MNYEAYTTKDFTLDSYFIEWILTPSDSSNQFWLNWISEHPEKRESIEEAKVFVLQMRFKKYTPSPEEYTTNTLRLNEEIDRFENKHDEQQSVVHIGRSLKRYWIGIAASITLLLAVATGLYLKDIYSPITIQTTYGEIKRVVLPDQSVVTLNANSVFRYKEIWDDASDRDVWLEGEAFFEVSKKEKKQKFTVHTQTLNVVVIGTKFNVNDRKKRTQVVLSEGKVILNSHLLHRGTTVPMQVGELVEFTESSKQFRKKMVRPEVYSSWKNREWILDNISLREVALKIEDTYGVKVVIKDPTIARQVVTGVVPTQSLELLLKALSTAFNLNIQHQEDQILINS